MPLAGLNAKAADCNWCIPRTLKLPATRYYQFLAVRSPLPAKLVPARALDAVQIQSAWQSAGRLRAAWLRPFPHSLSSYRNINLKRSNVSLRKRLADGQLNFLLKDYVRASIILFDAVENNPGNRGIAWYEALFYLAESLYHNRNYISASTHYQTLVKHKKRHYDKALVRLMEIAEKTKNDVSTCRYTGRLRSGDLLTDNQGRSRKWRKSHGKSSPDPSHISW